MNLPILIHTDCRGIKMSDLSQLFAEKHSNSLEWNGSSVYGLYEFDALPESLVIEFLSAKDSPVQGIHLRIKGGRLVVGETEAEDIVLWHDSAPNIVEVKVKSDQGAVPNLKMWNVWRGGLDVTQAWLGNAAIEVKGNPQSGRFTLQCSDGEGEPTFDDLVVAVTVDQGFTEISI